jgi:hypothetical protein
VIVGDLTRELRSILGREGFVKLAQSFGGTRLYVPYRLADDGELVEVLGREIAEKLSRALAPATIRVPLARRDRALFYRERGLSNRQIARRLGIGETGVEKLFAREPGLSERPNRAHSSKQLDLF